jgi:predicted ester cyclase
MSAEDNKAVVRMWYEQIWNSGDLAVIEECFAPQVQVHGQSIDWNGVRDGVSYWHTVFPDFRWHVDHLIAEGDMVAAHVHFTGTHRSVFHAENVGPFAPTGRSVNVQEMNFFRLAAGKVVEFWFTWDKITFAQQLEGEPPEAAATITFT